MSYYDNDHSTPLLSPTSSAPSAPPYSFNHEMNMNNYYSASASFIAPSQPASSPMSLTPSPHPEWKAHEFVCCCIPDSEDKVQLFQDQLKITKTR